MPPSPPGPGPVQGFAVPTPGRTTLSAEHRAKLRASALTDQHIDALGWSTLHTGRLLIPYIRPDGSPETCHDGNPFTRERLSQAEIDADPKAGKYRSPKGEGCRLFHSPLAIRNRRYHDRLLDRFTALRITEGEAKTVAANLYDPHRVTIGLGGVSSWRDRYDGQAKDDESKPITDWDDIPLDGRETRLCFDSDIRKPQVAAELRKLSEFLLGRGAHVLIEVLPHGLDGARLGIDDLIHRHGPAIFLQIADIARCPFKTTPQKVLWVFNPEPSDTRQRNTYLAGMIGRHWRRNADGRDRWHQWTGTHWAERNDDDSLAAAIESFADLQGWQNRELATVRSLQAAFRRSLAPTDAPARPGVIPFANGCLDIASGALQPHSPDNGNTWCLPYGYDPQASCEGVQALLMDRLEDPASVAMFRAFARSILTGERCKAFLEITGPSNTGKSVLASLLTALVGAGNVASMTLQRLEDRAQRFETLKLRGARLAMFSECQDYSGQLQMLKAITGGDLIPAEVKGGKHLNFHYTGGVVLVGNGPVRASDPTGAVITRRRTLYVGAVVAARDERRLIEPDGNGGWAGELAAELPGFVNWALSMAPADATRALSRDTPSLNRAEAELYALLETDHLAQWADMRLVWDPASRLQVGTADANSSQFLFPSYLKFIEQQGPNGGKPLALRTFKAKLVDLLRDTGGLPLPAGRTNAGEYRERGTGSVVPCVRFRLEADEGPGVVRHAYLLRVPEPEPERMEEDPERQRNAKTPVGNGRNGCNGIDKVMGVEEERELDGVRETPNGERGGDLSVPSVPPSQGQGFIHAAPVPESVPEARSVPPPPSGTPITVDGRGGWLLPGALPRSEAPTVKVVCVDPAGNTRLIERKRIALGGGAS
jgi:phage/plasmid-associated DNA primase